MFQHKVCVISKRCDIVRFRASGGAREGSIAACKSSRTLLCECGGWEAAALLCSALSLYNAGLSAHTAHTVGGKEILFYFKFD